MRFVKLEGQETNSFGILYGQRQRNFPKASQLHQAMNCQSLGIEFRNLPASLLTQSAYLIVNGRLGREIPEEVAAKTDHDNEFPSTMWKKLGEAG